MTGASQIDLLWVLLSAALVALMQLGFLLLEAGVVRSKNAVSVALKNASDFCVAVLAFWGIGFALMFGAGGGALSGPVTLGLGGDEPERLAFFLFQATFCGTAATIVSGAVAERMRFRGYMAVALLISALIYPIFGRWAWGGLLEGEAVGWLERLGFADFAGSTVVHSVGGWVALAAVLVIGPRERAFSREEGPPARDLALSAGGALLLWIGWLGFNGGSTLAFDARVPAILVNTILAASAGGAGGLATVGLISGRARPGGAIGGIVAGLVAITAGADAAAPAEAVALGAAGGAVSALAGAGLRRLRIDDPVGAIPAHLVAGALGTLAVPLLEGRGDGPLLEAIGVQAAGVAAAGVWAFGIAFPALKLLDRLSSLRPDRASERAGLDLTEHGAGSALLETLAIMEAQRREGDFSARVPVEPGEEAGLVADQYNRVLARVEEEIAAREGLAERLAEARDAAEASSRAKSQFLSTMSHELRTPMNGVLGLAAVLERTGLEPRQQAMVSEMRASGERLVSLLGDLVDIASEDAPEFERAAFAPADLAASLDERWGPEATRRGLGFEIRCDDAAGARRSGAVAVIRRVADHLIDNAVRFSTEGTVRVRFETLGASGLGLVVRDQGPGLPAGSGSDPFAPFAQGDASATRASGGAGVGLAVVARLARIMGGEARIVETSPEGTTVRVAFPATLVADPRAETTAAG